MNGRRDASSSGQQVALEKAAIVGDVDGVIDAATALLNRLPGVITAAVRHGNGRSTFDPDQQLLVGPDGGRGASINHIENEVADSSAVAISRDGSGPSRLEYHLRSLDHPIGTIEVECVREDTEVTAETIAQIGPQIVLAIEHATLKASSRRMLHETVTVLAAVIEGRDAYTERHCINLAEMSLAVGLRLGLPSARLDTLTYSGLLHDIGKIAVPDSILNKPGSLTESEFEAIKTHARTGEDILGRISALSEVGPIVGQHHERFDGNGYPRGLEGENILLEARILAVADAFDAMTTTRPYRPALSWSHAVHELSSNSGTQFDPEVLSVFLRYLEGEEAQWRNTSPT